MVGDLSGSCGNSKLFRGFSAASGDKPAFRVPHGGGTLRPGRGAGGGVQRSLSAAGVPVSGQRSLADGESGPHGSAGLRLGQKRPEAERGVPPAEHGPGWHGHELWPGRFFCHFAGGGSCVAAQPGGFRRDGGRAGICASGA